MTCFRFFKAGAVIFTILLSSQVFGQFVVNDTGDQGDAIPGDGTCETAFGNGNCTLRAAIEESNANIGPNTIDFSLASGSLITIDTELLINDNKTTINADLGNDGKPDIVIVSGAAGINGFHISSADNIIQGFNLIQFSGPTTNAPILIDGPGATGNTIITNYVGTSLAGDNTTGTGNFRSISIVNGATSNMIGNGTVAGRNIISANSFGIGISGSNNNQVIGNIIGLDIGGTIDFGNSDAGITVSGSTGTLIGGAGDGRNFISGNGQEGIVIDNSSTNTIIGNYIGLTANGIFALGNTNDGIFITSTSTNNTIGGAGQGNVISSNGGRGITIAGDANFVYGNFIGVQSGGNGLLGNINAGIVVTGSNNEIGDAVAGFGNVISSNSYGIGVSSGADNIIDGNYIGLNSVGNFALPNINEGIRITGTATGVLIGDGTAAGANYISGNGTDGISISGVSVTNITIDYNIIGTEIDGVSPMGNGGNGIFFDNDTGNNLVQNSVIANNADNGIEVNGGAAITIISQNSIYNNTNDGIRIGSGPPNRPSVDNISLIGVIDGKSDPSATVEIFFDAADEGQSYLATVVADASGDWSYTASLSDFPSGLLNVTATQLTSGFTSEFSDKLAVPFAPFVVINTNDSGAGSLRWAIENANFISGPDNITFSIPNTDPNYVNNAGNERWTISPLTDLPEITDPVIVDATTQPGGGNFRIKLDGQGVLSNGFTVSSTPTEFYGLYITGFSSAGIFANNPGGGGIFIGDVGKGNVINACGTGISTATASNHVIKGNFIGTDETGMSAVPNNTGIGMTTATNVVIGGSLPGEGNVISGNTGTGINQNVGNDHYYEGNFIGTNALGTAAIPNSLGIQFGSSGGHVVVNNVISGNVNSGIRYLNSGFTTIQGNKIGVGLNGTDPIPNGRGIYGFSVSGASNHIIGGTGAGEANIIAHNLNQGIYFENASHINNQFIANSIFCNGGKGIDLNGVANFNKSAPVITSTAAGSVSGTGIDGDVIHVYRDNGGCDPIQGEEYLGMDMVTVGLWSVLDASIVATDLINATATDASNNTSEFAINFREPPVAYNATEVTITDFVANFSVPASSNDILIDVADNIGFSTPLIQDLSVGLTGAPTISVGLTPGTDYYFRVRSQVGAGFSGYATSSSFRVSPGNALDFDGVDDVVVIPDNDDLDFGSGDFTIECWFKPNTLTDGRRYLVAKEQVGERQFALQYDRDFTGNVKDLSIIFYRDDDTFSGLDSDPNAINDLNWHHVAALRTGNNFEIYVDGILIKSGLNIGSSGGAMAASLSDFHIGSSVSTLGYVEGEIDEVRLWNVARTQTEIQNNMFNTLTGNEANLVAYYRFDQGTAGVVNTGITTLPDLSLNSNDGTLTNFDLGIADVLNSNWVNSDAFSPLAPTDLFTTEVSPTQIGLTWIDNALNETGFTIERSDGNNSFYSVLNTVAADAISYSDNTVAAGNGYFYRIIANGASGDSAPSNEKFASTIIPPGNALHFSGDDDYVNAGEFMPQSYTKEAWVRIESGSDRNNFISSDDIINGHYLYAPVVNFYHLSAGHFDGGALMSIIDVVPLDFDKWYHVAVTYDAGSQDMILYKNGQVVGNQTVLNHSDPTVLLGSHNFLNLLTGNLDEVRIWDDVRTPAEIQNNMFNTLMGNEANLAAYYRFDQGMAGGDNTSPAVNLLPDRSINNNNGTLMGFTLNGANSNWVNSDAQKPIILDATNITTSGFTANWQPVAGATDILIQVDEDPNFGSPLVDDLSVATGGTASVIQSLNPGIYYYRFKADIGGLITLYSVSSKFILPPGNALDFDGANDVVVIPDGASLDFGDDDFTIEFWVSSTRGNGRILNKHNCGTGNGWVITIGSSGNIEFYVNVAILISTKTVIDGNWHHVAVSFNAATNEQSIYIDGLLDGSQIGNNGNANNAPIGIGAWASAACGGAGGDAAEGTLDEVRFWNTTRTLTEIQNNMYNELIGNEFGLAAYYNFNQGVAGGDNTSPMIDILTDLTSNVNDGTLANIGLTGSTSNWVESGAFTPLVPTNLITTEISSTQIDLSWTDNALNETGYTIERSDGNNFSYSVLNTVGADVTSFSDNTVTAENGYFYRVIANGVSGDSNPSNEKFGSTIAPPGNALDFDGVDDQIRISDHPSLRFGSNDFTIECWIYPTALTGNMGFNAIITKHNGADGSWLFRITENGSTGNVPKLNFESDAPAVRHYANTEISLNQWHHVAVVLESGTGTFYLDGISDGTFANSEVFTTLEEVLISGQGDQTDERFTGQMDEIRLWNSAKSQPEIQSNMFNTLVGNEANLVAYYRFDQGTAGVVNTGITTLPDRSLNGNDGTLTNFDMGVANVLISNWVNSFGPEIGVLDGAIPIIDGQVISVDVGSNVQGTDIDKVLTIENTGTRDLNIASITVAGTDFSILAGAPTLITAGGSASFTLRLSGAATGTFNDVVTILNDDVDEGTFDFPVTGTITASPEPEIGVLDGVTTITDGQATAVDAGTAIQGTDIDKVLTIENTGTADLNITSITVAGTDFSILAGTPTLITTGGSATFTLRLSGAATGTFNDVVTILNDDADEGTFDFPVTGTIATLEPEIGVLDGVTPIIDGQATAVDTGAATQGTDIDKVFTIENTGTADLNITSITVSGTDFSILAGAPASIISGGSATFTLRLSGAAAGTFNEIVTILNDDADEAVFTFPVTGVITAPEIAVFQGMDNTGIPVMDGQAAVVDFGGGVQGTDLIQTFAIENTGTSDLNISIISVSASDFSIDGVIPAVVAPGSTELFTVKLSGLTIGGFSDNIVILNDDPDESTFSFPVGGAIFAAPEPEIGVFVGADVTGTPLTNNQVTDVDMGSAVEGTDIDQTFTIENTGSGILTITGITVSDTDFSISGAIPTVISPGATDSFIVRLSGALPGSYTTTVTITSDDSDEGTFSYPVSGVITAPEIAVYHGADNSGTFITDGQTVSIDFGSALEGVDIDQTFAIENGGTADLIISDISVSGTDFSIVGAIPATVIAGATFTFTIRLGGVIAGTFNATVTITSNDTDESVFDFNITGRIDMLAMVVRNGNNNTSPVVINGQPDPVDLGQTPRFVALDEVFIIENTGSNVLNIFSITTDNIVFTVINAPSSVAPGAFEQFIIRLGAESLGVFTATVSVDSDAGNYSFFVTGEVLDIESPPITVYNAVSPDGNGMHDYLKIVNIEAYPDNQVVIYDRYGNKVFEISGYSNNDSDSRFEGKTNTGSERVLESGTYYYLIDKNDGSSPESGFFLLSR